MPITEAALLRARGVEVDLDGQTYRLKYDFDALEQIETEFDGLDNFIEGLSTWTKRYRTLRRALVIGLQPALTPEDLGRLLNEAPHRMPAYLVAVNEALSQGMGLELASNNDDPKVTGSGDSPGRDSTGSPLSILDGQTPSSGE